MKTCDVCGGESLHHDERKLVWQTQGNEDTCYGCELWAREQVRDQMTKWLATCAAKVVQYVE